MALISLARRNASRCALLLLAASAAPAAWSQAAPVGAVAYAPLAAAANVPTLSQWASAALVLALAALTARALRRQGKARSFLPALVACAALVSMPWGTDVVAAPVSDVLLDNPAGGVAPIPDHPNLEIAFMDYLHEYEVQNTTDRVQRITAVSVTPGHRLFAADSDGCTVGQALAPLAMCYVRIGRLH